MHLNNYLHPTPPLKYNHEILDTKIFSHQDIYAFVLERLLSKYREGVPDLLYILRPFSMTACRSSEVSLPKGLPLGGSGAPAATAGAPDSERAPHVT